MRLGSLGLDRRQDCRSAQRGGGGLRESAERGAFGTWLSGE